MILGLVILFNLCSKTIEDNNHNNGAFIDYWGIIFIHSTFNFVYFNGRTIHNINITTIYVFTLVIFNIIQSPRIQVSSKMSINVSQTTKFSAHKDK